MKKSGPAIIIIMAVNIILPFANGNQTTKEAMDAFQGNCSFSVEIETTCAPSAGTSDVIGIRFGDSVGNLVLVKHLTNPKLVYDPREGERKRGIVYGGFERCAVDMFVANGTCMRSVCSLYVRQFGSDGWRPGWVKVLHQHNGGRMSSISYTFYYRTFVPENVWFGFDYCGSNRPSQPQVAPCAGHAA